MSTSTASNAVQELHRFFSLIPTASDMAEMRMPACVVDSAWHSLLKDESQYIRFCAESVGAYIEHAPGQGHTEIKWVKRYEQAYGQLPSVWFTAEDGSFDAEGYKKYLDTGAMIASWDCGPVMPDKGRSIQSDIANLKKVININKKIADLNDIPIPELEQMEKIDEASIIDSIKEKIDRFNIEKIKEKYPKA